SSIPRCHFAYSPKPFWRINLFPTCVEGRSLAHAPLPSAITCPSLMSRAANAKAFWFNRTFTRVCPRTPIAERRIANARERANAGFVTMYVIKSARNVCLRPGSGKQYSLQRAVAQLGSAFEWGSRGRGFKSRRPDFFFYERNRF